MRYRSRPALILRWLSIAARFDRLRGVAGQLGNAMAPGRFHRTVAMLALLWVAGTPGFLAAAQSGKTKAEKAPAVKEDSGPWFLAGRDGACVPTSLLAKKGPEYSDIQSPYQLADKLRAAGHKAEIKEFNAGSRPAVEVRAPSADLYVMFIKKQFCDKPTPPAEK